jgi:hypothetical protein
MAEWPNEPAPEICLCSSSVSSVKSVVSVPRCLAENATARKTIGRRHPTNSDRRTTRDCSVHQERVSVGLSRLAPLTRPVSRIIGRTLSASKGDRHAVTTGCSSHSDLLLRRANYELDVRGRWGPRLILLPEHQDPQAFGAALPADPRQGWPRLTEISAVGQFDFMSFFRKGVRLCRAGLSE